MAFVATTRADEARRFYGQTLGLVLTEDDGFALVFDAGGTMLRVVRVEALQPAAHTVLGFKVDDIASAVADLASRGVVFERFGFLEQDPLGVWRAPGGAQVAWFKDPDDNTLSLTQFPVA
jgi:catechol 2,3-dioxygenase-like lactoylglutathione lyase family enzyme